MNNKTYDIFISYSRHDIEIVRGITTFLQDRGYSVWIDLDGVECGDSFRSVIVNAIENSSILLFFSSKYSNDSRWINKEISIAVDENKYIIPIKLDDTKYNPSIRFDLIDLDFIDMSKEHLYFSGKNRLLKTISNKFDSFAKPLDSEIHRESYGISFQNQLIKRLVEDSKLRNIGITITLAGVLLISTIRIALSLIDILNPLYIFSSVLALLSVFELSLNRKNGIMWWIAGSYVLQLTELSIHNDSQTLEIFKYVSWQPIALICALAIMLILKHHGKTWWSICNSFSWYGFLGIAVIIGAMILQSFYTF